MADERKPMPQVVTPADVEKERQRRAAEEAAAAPVKRLDETVPGGRYVLDDGETVVDAEGKPLKRAAADKADDGDKKD